MGAIADYLLSGNPTGYGLDAVSFADVSPSDPGGSGYGGTSGWQQTLTALGTGYLSRRLDIDLQERLWGAQPQPNMQGSGPMIRTGTNGVPVVSTAQAGMSAVLPWLLPLGLLAVAAVVMMRRG